MRGVGRAACMLRPSKVPLNTTSFPCTSAKSTHPVGFRGVRQIPQLHRRLENCNSRPEEVSVSGFSKGRAEGGPWSSPLGDRAQVVSLYWMGYQVVR